MKYATVCDRAGEVIAAGVRAPQLNRLRGYTEDGVCPHTDALGRPVIGRQLVWPHPKRENLWLLEKGVTAEDIQASLAEQISLKRNEISNRPDATEANFTWSKSRFSNDSGSGRVFTLNLAACFRYATTEGSVREHEQRKAIRPVRRQPAFA